MNTKIYFIMGVLAALGYAAGRWSAPEKVKIETKIVTVEVEKKTENTDKKENIKSVEVVKPDGTKTTTTEIIADTKTKSETNIKETTKEDTKQTTQKSTSSLIVEGLVSGNINDLSSGLTYGGHISNNLIGPIRIGAFGFTNRNFGVSLGLQF